MFSFAKIFAVEVICFSICSFLINFVYIKRIVMAYQKKESLSWCLVVQNSLKVALKRCDFDIKNVAFFLSKSKYQEKTYRRIFRLWSNLSFCLTWKTFGNWSRRQNHWAPRFDQAWVQMKTQVLYVLLCWKAMDRGSMQSSSWKFYKPSEFSWQSRKDIMVSS